MTPQETDEQFFARLQDQWSKERQAALDALQNHPGPCTCVYHVHFQQREKKFDTLADAFIWSAQRERDELQYTEKYLLDDGSELLKTTSQWSIADELEATRCATCGKQFKSYRALNGHRNAHIKR